LTTWRRDDVEAGGRDDRRCCRADVDGHLTGEGVGQRLGVFFM
jgi:hypothetical protein